MSLNDELADKAPYSKQLAAIERLCGEQSTVTVVPMQASFEDDRRLSLGIFACIPDDIAARIGELQRHLQAIETCHHYLQRDSLHMTVQNVQTIALPATFTVQDAQRVAQVVSQTAQRHHPKQVLTSGVIQLATSLSVAVLYDESMLELIAELNDAIAHIGLPDNKQYIDDSIRFGNITLARFTRSPSRKFTAAAAAYRNMSLGNFQVDSLAVASTNAVYDPAHTRVFGEFALTKRGQKRPAD